MDSTIKDNPSSGVAVLEKPVEVPQAQGAGNEPPGPPTAIAAPAGEPDPTKPKGSIMDIFNPSKWAIFRHPEATKKPDLTVLPGGKPDNPGPTEGGPGVKPPIPPGEPTNAASTIEPPKVA